MSTFDNNDVENILSTKYKVKLIIDDIEYSSVSEFIEEAENQAELEGRDTNYLKVLVEAEVIKFLKNTRLRTYILRTKGDIVDTSKTFDDNLLGKILTCIRSTIEKKNLLTIASWNVNGIRSRILDNTKSTKCKKAKSIEKGSNLDELITKTNSDIICFQEARCDDSFVNCFKSELYPYQYWSCGEKKGYAGTSIWSKIEANKVLYNLPTLSTPDKHGRIIIAEFDKYILINTYVPNSGTNEEYRINDWQPAMLKYLRKNKHKKIIWCGDLNVAHNPIDVFFAQKDNPGYVKRRAEGMERISGYLPEERLFMKKLLKNNYVDIYREQHPTKTDAFTWWNPRVPGLRITNQGWRIDYFIISDDLVKNVISSDIFPEIGTKTIPQGSDHCPITLTINLN